MSARTFIKQCDQSGCGAAALAMVAAHHGLTIPYEQMRELTGTDRVGTSLLGLLKAAEALGFCSKGVQAGFEHLSQIPLPAIAHVRNAEGLGHFVVVRSVKSQQVEIADPGKDEPEWTTAEEFCRNWNGCLLILSPEPGLSKPAGRGQAISPFVRFCGLFAGQKGILLEALVCALLMTALGIFSSYVVQHLVDNVLVRSERRLLNALGIGMVLVLVFKLTFSVCRQYLLAFVGRKIDLALLSSYTRHVLKLPLSFFETRRIGDILARTQDAGQIREAVNGTTLSTILDALMVVVSMGVLWAYDARLALVATVFVPALILSVVAFQPATRRKVRESMEQSAKLSSHVVEDVSGVETIKAFGAERLRAEEGESHLIRLVQTAFSMQKLSLVMGTLGGLLHGVAGLTVLWYGGHRVMSGAMTVGQLMFFYSMLDYLLDPLERLSSANLNMQEAFTAVDRFFQILDLPAESANDARRAKLESLQTGISLRDVTFRYGSRGDVLKQLSLEIPAGQTVAIVGESGSGKSTLLKLLMGFYSPTDGNVRFDGIDSRDYDLASLRSRIGLVSQEPFIFTGSIHDNIAFGCPQVTLNEVSAAARQAGLEEFIESLPQRYDTIIGERGANLSGGQRQRLAIARALLRSPDILIFDEATSHLDTATERAIQENLRTAFLGRTVVLVAHRLSTIRDADRIYVLHDGQIVEQGTHTELVEAQRYYSSLWQAQTAGTASITVAPATALSV